MMRSCKFRLISTFALFFAVILIGMLSARAESRLAPHGDAVVYELNGDIYSCDLPEGKPHRLTRDGGNEEPVWSPSGNWIAYFHDSDAADGGLHLMRRDGSANHSLPCQLNWQRSFSFSSSAEEIAIATDDGALAIAPLLRGKVRRVVQPSDGDATSIVGVAWSPDGRKLAYVTEHSETQKGDGLHSITTPYIVRLWQMNASGIGRPKLVFASNGHKLAPVISGWSSDSLCLFFWTLHEYPGGSINLDGMPLYACRVGANTGMPHRLFGSGYEHEVLSCPDFVQFSPHCSRAAVAVGGSRFWTETKRIAFVDLRHPMSWHYVTGTRVAATCPAWSPNGKLIAYLAAPTAIAEAGGIPKSLAQMRLWVMNADGNGQRQMNSGQVAASAGPRWLADGRHLLFERVQTQGIHETHSLWLIDSDGTHLRCVVPRIGGGDRDDSRSGRFEVWSPR